VSTRDFSWGKGGRCVWLTTYHPCSAEMSRKSGAFTYPEPLGPPRPVAGHLYFLHVSSIIMLIIRRWLLTSIPSSHLHRLIIPDDVLLQFDLLMMSIMMLETRREMK